MEDTKNLDLPNGSTTRAALIGLLSVQPIDWLVTELADHHLACARYAAEAMRAAATIAELTQQVVDLRQALALMEDTQHGSDEYPIRVGDRVTIQSRLSVLHGMTGTIRQVSTDTVLTSVELDEPINKDWPEDWLEHQTVFVLATELTRQE